MKPRKKDDKKSDDKKTDGTRPEDKKPEGKGEQVTSPKKEGAIKIAAPAEVMATDIFQASAQIPSDMAGRASEYRWSGPALLNPDKKGSWSTKAPQATLQFLPMTGRSGDTFDPNQRISLYVTDAAGLSVASGEVAIKLKPVGFSASASWEVTPVRNGFDLKRKEAKKQSPCGDKTCVASVNGRLQLRWHEDSFSADNMDDLKKSVNNLHVGKIRGTYHGVQPGKDEEFAIGDFKGYMAHKPPQLYYTGVPDMVDLTFPNTISWFAGYLMKGKSVIFINGDVYGGGERKGEKGNFWFDDTPFVEQHTKAAYAEMMAVIGSIAIGPDNKINKIPYKGPALDGSDLPSVKLVFAQKGKLKIGDVIPVKAVVENAKPEDSPLKFEWSGDHEGKGETVNFMAQKAGKNTLAVTVTGARFPMGSASATFEVEDLKAVIVKDAPSANSLPVGTKARFSAALTSGGQKVSGNYIYRWQPGTEVTFEPSEGAAPQTSGTFRKTGKTRVWVEVLLKKGDVLSTLARSENLELDIISPKLSLSAAPEAPLVGQEVKVTVQEDPKMDEKTVDFWWEIAGDAANPGPLRGNRIYSYRPKDTKPVTVTVHAKGRDKGDDLGSQKITVTAKSYTVSVSSPRYHGPKPRIWKCNTELGKECPGLVEVGDTQFAVHHDIFMKAGISPSVDRSKLRYKWTVSPEGCTGGGSISDEIRL
ncbi:MAG TPA: hypothetical protein VN328_04405, partial [Thermodesulfovibrionales bacterium]|nr:hypothetical protein [Thermodesulfovibrionales bacterium]